MSHRTAAGVLRSLLQAARTQPVVHTTTISATTSLVMVLCGGCVAVATLLRPDLPHTWPPLAVALSAVVGGLVLWPLRRRLRASHHLVVHPVTALVLGLGVHLDGGGTASATDAGLFAVMVVVAFFYFPWATAAVMTLFTLVVASAALASVSGVSSGDLVVLAGKLATTGVVVGLLSRSIAAATAAAEVDVLTGLPNRRGAENRLTAALAAHRGGTPLSLAVLDLDHFKQVNDSLGHAAGDELLRRAASSWAALLPPAAVLGRWGGDEFVLLARLDPASTADLTERMRSALPPGRSCTAGVTGLAVGDDLDAALSRADQGLYAAKRAGRGLTEVWTPALAGGQPWLESHPSMRSDSGSSGSSTPDSSGASSPSIPTAAS
ncbi:GGDEF domain-containing protein [Quadrisphaera sp. INWT6]|uniref:GGDEF domain-containing protein n=1 Tax=Quadrisphaera sp. INWT6 TaxID=2596917 RepID=UPI0018928150|nr:GGDEF domain-containing protein [Quadrisphaera sp. INWT6]MBF5081900.1 GGDEF domain-containing protein [Quadrisphaera sp. INWT6]